MMYITPNGHHLCPVTNSVKTLFAIGLLNFSAKSSFKCPKCFETYEIKGRLHNPNVSKRSRLMIQKNIVRHEIDTAPVNEKTRKSLESGMSLLDNIEGK